MLTDYAGLQVYINGVFQKLVTNVAAVSDGKGVGVIIRGIFRADEQDILWLNSNVGDDLDLVLASTDGSIEIGKRVKLQRKTVGQNVQGKYAFWHVRLDIVDGRLEIIAPEEPIPEPNPDLPCQHSVEFEL